ncbi:MAG: PAS domain-containing protein [Planctomycetes bacterium]|nr:PAS domain-containing protein [Planctomycetota bacterium]
MFRVNDSELQRGHTAGERVLLVALVLALLANFGSAYLILHEYHGLGDVDDGVAPMSAPDIAFLRQEVGIQFVVTLVVSAILVFCTAAIWWLRRRYFSSQRSLHQLKILAHDILASMDRGVVTTNREGVITSINSAAIRLLQVDFDCVGRPLASISRTEVPLLEVYREVVNDEVSVRDRDVNVDRASRVLRLRVDGHPLNDNEGKSLGCVIHLRDVTERMLMEERLRRMERFLSLATLASGLHHEIKNPLTALSIHIQLLAENLSNGHASEAVDEIVGVLKTEVCRLNGVLESFRSFANLQNLSVQPTDALEVVESAIRFIQPQAADQHVQITLLHPEKDLPLVPLDVEKFQQAILNLIINALEAMPEGGHLTVTATIVDEAFRVSVQDSGSGIPPEVQPNLFQPYFSTKTTGSGMGLALSEKLIGQHGGHIAYCTGPEGTTFEITIPCEQHNGNA